VRVIFDTNILISSLIGSGPPSHLWLAWLENRFDLLGHDQLIEEFRQIIGGPKFLGRFPAHIIGRRVNLLRAHAIWLDRLPKVDRSSDPNDNFVLAMAEAGRADFLVTGDKSGLLALHIHGPTQIITARGLLERLAAN
jgi:uncharacterized protein